MIRKLVMIIAFAIFASGFLLSFKLQAIEVLPEVKAAYFYPTHNRFRAIYHDGGIYSIETSVKAWDQLYPWMSLGVFYQTGRSLENRFGTNLLILPIGLGLKYLFTYKQLNPYLGVGMQVTYTHMHDKSPYVDSRFAHWGMGGMIKTGFLAYFTKSCFFDFFCDYSYLKINYHHRHPRVVNLRTDLSSISIGAGVGYRF